MVWIIRSLRTISWLKWIKSHQDYKLDTHIPYRGYGQHIPVPGDWAQQEYKLDHE